MSRIATVTLTGPAFIDGRGRPHGWMRPHPVIQGGKVVMVTERDEKAYRIAVAARMWEAWHAAGHRGPIEGPAVLRIVARFRRPIRFDGSARPTSKPDDDNIGKSIRDAMARNALGAPRPKGRRGPWGLLGDDCQVAEGWTSKVWDEQGGPGSLTILFGELGQVSASDVDSSGVFVRSGW